MATRKKAKKKAVKKAARKKPARKRAVAVRKNPTRKYTKKRVVRKKRRRGVAKYRRNPAGVLKRVLRKENIIHIAGITLGAVGANVAVDKTREIEQLNFIPSHLHGLIPLVIGSVAAVTVKNKEFKSLGIGLAVGGAIDLVNVNLLNRVAAPAEAVEQAGIDMGLDMGGLDMGEDDVMTPGATGTALDNVMFN